MSTLFRLTPVDQQDSALFGFVLSHPCAMKLRKDGTPGFPASRPGCRLGFNFFCVTEIQSRAEQLAGRPQGDPDS